MAEGEVPLSLPQSVSMSMWMVFSTFYAAIYKAHLRVFSVSSYTLRRLQCVFLYSVYKLRRGILKCTQNYFYFSSLLKISGASGISKSCSRSQMQFLLIVASFLVIVLYLHSALALPFVMVNGRRMGHYNRQRERQRWWWWWWWWRWRQWRLSGWGYDIICGCPTTATYIWACHQLSFSLPWCICICLQFPCPPTRTRTHAFKHTHTHISMSTLQLPTAAAKLKTHDDWNEMPASGVQLS